MARGDDVTSFNAKRVRSDIPQLNRVIFDRPITFLDTASTSLQPNAVIDAMSIKVKNRASLLLDFVSGKTTKPNEIMKRALDCLAQDGKLATGDKGNCT